jgi:hypothetical protein
MPVLLEAPDRKDRMNRVPRLGFRGRLDRQ